MIAAIIFLLLAVGCIAYIGLLYWDVNQDVQTTPRTPMSLCSKHGAIPEKYLVHFSMEGVLEKPIDMCPFCWEDQMAEAKKKL